MQVSMHLAEWDSYLKNGSWGWRGVVLVDFVSFLRYNAVINRESDWYFNNFYRNYYHEKEPS
jgi:hypothetical protein